LQMAPPAPVESLVVERVVMKPGSIEVLVRNASPGEITLAQVIINDAVWPFTVSPDPNIPRLSEATARAVPLWPMPSPLDPRPTQFLRGGSYDPALPQRHRTP